jgi:hypothetical protein
MNQMLAIYTAQWEWQARLRAERPIEAQQSWLTRVFQLATQPTPYKDRSLTERSTLKRLVNAPGCTY